jgi:tetratricopeptide (TPR) repeat protein
MDKGNSLRPVYFLILLAGLFIYQSSHAQALRLPDGVNLKSKAGRSVGVTDIEINWNAPGVKGREDKIWGTDIAPYGFTVLGFGSDVQSPWRAGANESTTISFSTDVTINGAKLAAGKYGFFIALYPDSCTLIFNKNTEGWGSYFYNSSLDVLRVTARQQKDLPESRELLDYSFSNQTKESVDVALEWEKWRIPFTVKVDLVGTTLAAIRTQMTGALGFDPPSLEAAANWCLQNKVNQEQALHWINTAVNPSLGGVKSFRALSTKAGLLAQLGKNEEADAIMKTALEQATAVEMHGYGRQLLAQGKTKEAMEIFQQNFDKNKGVWPTHVGLMRGYSAMGDLKKALEHAKLALAQAPDEGNKRALEQAVKTLSEGKPL